MVFAMYAKCGEGVGTWATDPTLHLHRGISQENRLTFGTDFYCKNVQSVKVALILKM